MIKSVVLFLLVIVFNLYGIDLPNYIKDHQAKSKFNKKDFNSADSIFSLIDNKKYSTIVDYNRAIVANAKNSYGKAISLYNKILVDKKIKNDQISFNLYRTYSDSALKALGTGDRDGSAIKLIKKSIKGFDGLYKNSKDSVVRNNSLQELYRLTQLLNKQNKNKKQQKNNENNNKNNKKDKKENKKKNSNNKNDENKKQQENNGGDKDKKRKSVDENMYKMLLDNVKENKKKMMEKEIKAMNKNQKEAW